ncbi:MAG: hypothetical protein RDA78_24505 [Roseibium sp.]|uniref:hypothetical protein n=1 Tax=Roseibium sp. TaxID=1936156 RepID=UPI003D9C472F
MKPLQKQTLQGVCDQMACHDWSEAELNELINPKMGIITGFQNLLEELEILRKTDLGTTPPALGVQKR